MVHISYLVRMVKVYLSRRMRFVLNLQLLRRVIPDMYLVFMFRIPPPMDSESNLLFIIRVPYLLEKGGETPGPIPLRERGRDFSPRQTNNEGPRIPRTKRGRISRRFFQIENGIFLCTPLGD